MKALRWAAILPAWLLGHAAAYYFVVFLFEIVLRFRGTGFLSTGQYATWAQWAGCFASGFVGVGVAAALVPQRRAPVAVGLAALEGLILAGLLIFAWEQSDYAMKIGAGLPALGAIAMACMAKSDPPKENLTPPRSSSAPR